ncbi:MAG: hypothetical protein CM15mP59_3370 [Flavobacteriaceae bacterium]|nr:MAG: hypothetical protein CM15mP59_3370 [Flavobacteriaceae bacterium]
MPEFLGADYIGFDVQCPIWEALVETESHVVSHQTKSTTPIAYSHVSALSYF